VTRDGEPPGRRRSRLDYHDPTAGIGGAPPAASALTLRLLLAGIGLACCVVGIVLVVIFGGSTLLIVILAALALTTVVDALVILGRKRRGEPG
jgi:membrane protein implicated in regulation of membrane protease activity